MKKSDPAENNNSSRPPRRSDGNSDGGKEGDLTTSPTTMRIKLALESALDILGEEPKRQILYYLEHQYGITFVDGKGLVATPPPIQEIKNALRAIFGSGADMLIIPRFERNCANFKHTQAS